MNKIMEDTLYIHQENIQRISLESRPYEDVGFDYETYGNFKELGEYHKGGAGLVSIDRLIESLQEMKSNGCNYVSCDWHYDHDELDLYGVKYRLATDEEINLHHKKLKQEEIKQREKEIEKLEAKLVLLRNLQNKQ